MPESYTEQVQQAFCGVIENLAFMFGDPVSKDELPPSTGRYAEATIAFSGPSAGTLTLVAPASIAAELAVNLLGLDGHDDATDETAADAMGELLNVTAGQLLPTIAGPEAVYDLSAPKVRLDAGTECWTHMVDDEDTMAFIVEDYPILLGFHIGLQD